MNSSISPDNTLSKNTPKLATPFEPIYDSSSPLSQTTDDSSIERIPLIDILPPVESNFISEEVNSPPVPVSRKRKLLKKAPDAPKRFKTAYVWYVSDHMEEVKLDLQRLHGPAFQATDVLKIIAGMWKTVSPIERMHYEMKAEQDKQRYFKELSNHSGPLQVPNKRQKKAADAPKKSMSAFLLFSKIVRPILYKENPHLKNTDISTLLSEKWRKMTDEEKKPYHDQELVERSKYYERMKEYKEKEREKEKNRETEALKEIEINIMTDSLDSQFSSESSDFPDLTHSYSRDTTVEEMSQISSGTASSSQSCQQFGVNTPIVYNPICSLPSSSQSNSSFQFPYHAAIVPLHSFPDDCSSGFLDPHSSYLIQATQSIYSHLQQRFLFHIPKNSFSHPGTYSAPNHSIGTKIDNHVKGASFSTLSEDFKSSNEAQSTQNIIDIEDSNQNIFDSDLWRDLDIGNDNFGYFLSDTETNQINNNFDCF